MKRIVTIGLFLTALLLGSCRGRGGATSNGDSSGDAPTSNTTGANPTSGTNPTSANPTNTTGSTPSNTSSTSQPDEDEGDGISIPLNTTHLDLVVGSTKTIYLTVNFPDGYEYDAEHGEWISSNSSIVSVSIYGKVTPVAAGSAYIYYRDSNGRNSNKCAVKVYASEPTKAWLQVTDFDSIQNGDVIVFGCPEFGVTASIDRKDGYLKPVESTFVEGGTKISDLGLNSGEYFVGDSEDGQSLTLENQEGYYLAGKKTTVGNGLLFVKSKGQIHWIFERQLGNDYSVNYDIDDDLWLMFNKISNTDIRFNLYDSNETELMKLAKVYRWEVVS